MCFIALDGVPDHLRRDTTAALLEERFDAYKADMRARFAASVTAELTLFVQAIFDHEAPRMVAGRGALLGDAAFVVRPHTAMGVAKMAGDAMALRAYERKRMPVGAAIAAYGRRLSTDLG